MYGMSQSKTCLRVTMRPIAAPHATMDVAATMGAGDGRFGLATYPFDLTNLRMRPLDHRLTIFTGTSLRFETFGQTGLLL